MSATTLEQRVLGEQIELLHKQAPSILAGTIISTGTLVWLLWAEPVVRANLLAWLVAVFAVVVLRWIGLVRYRADPHRLDRGGYWGWWFTLGSALAGACMGYLGWGFFQPTLLFLFPIALIMGAMVALSVPSAGVFFPAHVAFNLLSMTPFMLRNYMEEGRLFFGQSFAILFLMVSCLLFAYRQQATIRKAIRLRFENIDLLERVMAESRAADQARNLAQEANEAKSRFLAAASHDLRQPMQALSIFVQVLAEQVENRRLPDDALVGNLQSSCEGLEVLVDSLLDLSRAEIGAVKPDIRDVPLQAALVQLRREFALQARAKGLRLRVRRSRHVVRTDAALLLRILRNLTSNALRYTERGGVLICARRRGDRVRVEVRDSGVGIPDAARDDIFREFYQVGNPERDRRKGLGLGLAIVDGLARQLGIRVDLRTAPGRGSVFAVELQQGVQGTDVPVVEQLPLDVLQGRCIVVMDDEPMIRDAMQRMLSGWGCEVVVGETAEDVLRDLGGRSPAAILADWRLREGRLGTQEAREVQRILGREIPTLLITGDMVPDAELEAGLAVIRKPIQGFRLRGQLNALLAPPAAAQVSQSRNE